MRLKGCGGGATSSERPTATAALAFTRLCPSICNSHPLAPGPREAPLTPVGALLFGPGRLEGREGRGWRTSPQSSALKPRTGTWNMLYLPVSTGCCHYTRMEQLCIPARKLSCSRCGHRAVICRNILSGAFACMAVPFTPCMLRAFCSELAATNMAEPSLGTSWRSVLQTLFTRSASRVLDVASAFREGGREGGREGRE
jgi:hypothetical protein